MELGASSSGWGGLRGRGVASPAVYKKITPFEAARGAWKPAPSFPSSLPLSLPPRPLPAAVPSPSVCPPAQPLASLPPPPSPSLPLSPNCPGVSSCSQTTQHTDTGTGRFLRLPTSQRVPTACPPQVRPPPPQAPSCPPPFLQLAWNHPCPAVSSSRCPDPAPPKLTLLVPTPAPAAPSPPSPTPCPQGCLQIPTAPGCRLPACPFMATLQPLLGPGPV